MKHRDVHRQLNQIQASLVRLTEHPLVLQSYRPGRLLFLTLLRGVAFGLGSVLGATVVLSFLLYVLSQFEFLPFVGEWVRRLIEEVRQ